MNGTRYAGISIGFLGFVLLGITAGWLPTLAVLIMMWGNNLERISENGSERT